MEDTVSKEPSSVHFWALCSVVTLVGEFIALGTVHNPDDIPWPRAACLVVSAQSNDHTQSLRCADGTFASNDDDRDLIMTGRTVTISRNPKTGKWIVGKESTQVDNPALGTIWNVLGINILISLVLLGISRVKAERESR